MWSYMIFRTFPFFRVEHLLKETNEEKAILLLEKKRHNLPLKKENPMVPNNLNANLVLRGEESFLVSLLERCGQ